MVAIIVFLKLAQTPASAREGTEIRLVGSTFFIAAMVSFLIPLTWEASCILVVMAYTFP